MKSNNLEIFKEVNEIGQCLKFLTFSDYNSSDNFRTPSLNYDIAPRCILSYNLSG